MADNSKNNPWHRKARDKNNSNTVAKNVNAPPKQSKQSTNNQTTNTRFQEASAKMHASVQRHIQEYESSSEEEDLEEVKILDSVMNNYRTNSKDVDLGRTKEFLEQSFQSGAVICLVCIASVKRSQPIWSCGSCFTAFHLMCIQRWAKDTIYQQSQSSQPNLGELPVRDNSFKKVQWFCPKCRSPYNEVQVPNRYECFCKKKIDPEFHPWAVPHSCGDICDKPLHPSCGHRCLLLCHPGPCPPCPKMINMTCNCTQSPVKPVRCSVSSWCCSQICNKILNCNQHKCNKKCHSGQCDPCSKYKVQSCQCKSHKENIPCSQLSWQCNKVCEKKLTCGYHTCEQICHATICGTCPFTGLQKCPCGAVEKEVTCPAEVSSCGGSCNKTLSCGKHICPHKCHKDKCPQCLELVDKMCRCQLHTKQLPCSKQYTCETKCKNIKECGRHPCNKKCCNGDCLPCDKPCGRSLQCGKHKCLSVCHRGPCYPCQLTAKVFCRCGRTFYSVPCGRQKKSKPPKCSLNCRIPVPCCHIKENLHKCHFGACPTCKEQCGNLLSCGHNCGALCHSCVSIVVSSTKADTPCELQQPKIEMKALPCPPCKLFVKRFCLGYHEETLWPCHQARISSCGRKCGRPLACANHTCSKECHPVSDGQSKEVSTECEKCDNQCSLPKQEGCTHPCTRPCHPPPCKPCKQFLKRTCHCGLTELFLQCNIYTSAEPAKKENSLSCQQQCIKMLDCGHRCRIVCHSGKCPNDEICSRKTRMYCPCRRIKKDIPCHLVKENSLFCDDMCELKKVEDMQVKKELEEKKLLEEQTKNDREIAEFEKKFGKKKYKQRRITQDENTITIWVKYRILFMVLATVFVSFLIFIYLK